MKSVFKLFQPDLGYFLPLILFLGLIIVPTGLFGQNLCFTTLALISRAEKDKSSKDKSSKDNYTFPVIKINNKWQLSALLELKEGNRKLFFDENGITVRTKAGSIYSVFLPLQNLKQISKNPIVKIIQADRKKIMLCLDSARKSCGADLVQAGIGLPRAFHGTGVVVGVIDEGINYAHTTFYDSTATRFRVKAVWDQQDTMSQHPSGYNYGSEYAIQSQILAKNHDTFKNFSHGTHTSSIAAGSGWLTPNRSLRGIADDAEIIQVSSELTDTKIVDGTNYIFNYASSHQMPAVINMSFGGWGYAMDGTDLMDKALDSLTGPGKIIVAAMGNEGKIKQHLSGTLTPFDTIRTIANIRKPAGFYFDYSEMDLWTQNPSGKLILKIGFTDSVGNMANAAQLFDCAHNRKDTLKLISGSDTLLLRVQTDSAYHTNNCQHILVGFNNHSPRLYPWFGVSGQGNFHLLSPFINLIDRFNGSNFGLPGFQAGDSLMNQRAPGGTAKKIIAVGSYNTKKSYHTLDGINHTRASIAAEGTISDFSSHGPTIDGRMKPDVCAPGSVIVAALNQSDNTLNNQSVVYFSPFQGKSYPYGANSGTSMACPMVTGMVALLLEQNPSLNPDKVRSLLRNSAVTDSFTGSIPAIGSPVWGFGKANIAKSLFNLLPLNERLIFPIGLTIYPNPNQGIFEIQSENEALLSVRITDIFGKEIKEIRPENLQNLYNLPSGLYFIEAQYAAGSKKGRVVIE